MNNLTQALLDAGLLQFGLFTQNGNETPFRLSMEMLPSYPDVLKQITTAAQLTLTGINTDRIICTADSIPFGVALSLQIGVPLVYSQGSHAAPVFDLVGAYDVGHPAILITNTLKQAQPVVRLVANARRVGLDIHATLSIIDFGIVRLPDNITGHSLLLLPEIIGELTNNNRLTEGQAQAIYSWIGQQKLAQPGTTEATSG